MKLKIINTALNPLRPTKYSALKIPKISQTNKLTN